jgi:arylsulfatase A-like enzyme
LKKGFKNSRRKQGRFRRSFGIDDQASYNHDGGVQLATNQSKSNIVFILSDDQGEWAMGCSGNREIITPHLDRLAQEGLRLTNFFCASPVCSPARASILTGKIPSQHGVQDWIRDGNVGVGGIDYLADHTAYTDILAQHGYACGISGKWHLGNGQLPQKSFTHWYVHQKGSGNYFSPPMIRNGREVEEPGYVTDLITDDAISYLTERSADRQPFYLSVHYTAPHNPWSADQHPREFLDLYKDCPFASVPRQDRHHPEAVYQYSKDEALESLRGYYAATTAMDAGIGRLIETLERLGLSDNTLVVFTSDNGFNCGHHGIWGKGNGTFSLNMFDTSVKVPLIVRHPGTIAGGRISDALLSQYDIFPTLLDYAEIEYFGNGLPGKSFAPLLRGEAPSGELSKSQPGNDAIFVYDEYGPVRMVRSKEWKYVHRYPYGPHELYDLRNDPQEERNLAGEEANLPIVERMRAELTDWFAAYVDPQVDGVREPVRGNGQLTRPGVYARGRLAFDQGRMLTRDSHYDPGTSDREREKRNNQAPNA